MLDLSKYVSITVVWLTEERKINLIIPIMSTKKVRKITPKVPINTNVGLCIAMAISTYIITGSIAHSAMRRYLIYSRGRFWGFLPRRGDTLHRWGWNLGGGSSMPNFIPISATCRRGEKPQNRPLSKLNTCTYWGWNLGRKVPSSVPNFTPIGATIRV